MTEFDKYCGCSKPVLNGCPSQTDLGCTYYTGDKLDPLNIDKGTNGNSIIKIINDYIKNVLERLEVPPTRISNIGNKVGIYKDLSDQFIHEFKSLSGIEGIIINNTNDYIEISVDTEWLLDNIMLLFNNQDFKNFFVEYNKNVFETNIWKVFLESYLQTMFSTINFQQFFAEYISNLMTSNKIDICNIIGGCNIDCNCTDTHLPTLSSNITYTINNRSPINLLQTDFTNIYSDELNHLPVNIKIKGGNYDNVLYNGSPITTNMLIPISNANMITFTGKNIDTSYTQLFEFSIVNNNNEETITRNVVLNVLQKADTYADCIKLGTGVNYSDSIIKDYVYTGQSSKTIKVVNNCSTSFVLNAQTIFSEAAEGSNFVASIGSTTIPGNTTVDVPVYYNGSYKGSSLSLNYTITINGTTANYTINVIIPDVAPVTQDSIIELSNRENKIISSADLIYSDLNGDPITNVRFIGGTSRLFTDLGYTTQYISGTELPINFILYFKAPDQDAVATYQVQYNVKANGVWSS